jgi:type IV secretory pathway VirB2 component (pilin)
MQFPAITTWANNVVSLLQVVGGAIAVICVAVIALMILTSFGNTQRLLLARSAGVGVVVGIFVLLAADKIAQIFIGLSQFLQK